MASIAVWLPRASRSGALNAFRASAAPINSSLRSLCTGTGRSSIYARRSPSSYTGASLSTRQYLGRRLFSSTSFLRKEAIPEKDSVPFLQHDFESVNSSIGKKHAILIDVREPSELQSTGIIPGAVNIPLKSSPDAFFLSPDEFEDRFGYEKPSSRDEDQGKDLIMYCHAGVRARAAAELARQAGFKGNIGVYGGSWLDWDANKGKVAKWNGNQS